MNIELCDACGDRILDAKQRVSVSRGYHFKEFVFCPKCAEPIRTFLDKHLEKTKNRAV